MILYRQLRQILPLTHAQGDGQLAQQLRRHRPGHQGVGGGHHRPGRLPRQGVESRQAAPLPVPGGTGTITKPASNHIKQVLNSYQELLNKSYSLIDEEQIDRIVKMLNQKKRIYVYGKGSSSMVGMEMKLRFMRIGVNIESITDTHIMKMNSVLLDEIGRAHV